MFIYILLAVLFAKIKGYKIRPVLKAYSLYPYVAAEVFYLYLQACVFVGDYRFIQYTAIIKNIYFYTLIIPILYYKLYKPGIYGSILILIGTLLNRFVISQNGGKMPVFASLSRITGYYDEKAILTVDNIHVVGNEATRYKFLTDFIDIGTSILSIGDVLIHSIVLLIMFSVIKEVNKGLQYTIKAERNTNDGNAQDNYR